MKVTKFIEKLARYKDLTIYSNDAKDMLASLESELDYKAILTTKNLHKWIPGWKELKSIEISFTYQPNFDGLYIYTETISKDGTIKKDYDEFENNSPFSKRMHLIITNDNMYDKIFVKDCFQKELLDEFKKLKIKLIIGKCGRGDDT